MRFLNKALILLLPFLFCASLGAQADWENYSDRKRGAEIGKYAGATNDLFYSYAVPQENGNRTETRWLQLKDKKGSVGLRITGDPVFAFSVWPYSAAAIAEARHPYDLSP